MNSIAKKLTRGAKTGGSDGWRTPSIIIVPAKQYGRGTIALDPCASPSSKHHFAKTNIVHPSRDGLEIDWTTTAAGGLVFCNHPYSANEAWAAKICREAEAGASIIWLPKAAIETEWYRSVLPYADVEAIYRGRVPFERDAVEGESDNGATFASAILGFNVHRRRFERCFGAIADVRCPK